MLIHVFTTFTGHALPPGTRTAAGRQREPAKKSAPAQRTYPISPATAATSDMQHDDLSPPTGFSELSTQAVLQLHLTVVCLGFISPHSRSLFMDEAEGKADGRNRRDILTLWGEGDTP